MSEKLRRATQPEWLDSINRLNAQVREHSEKLQWAFASTIAPAAEQWSLQVPKLDRWVEQTRRVLEQWRRAWEEALPPNWADLSEDEVMSTVERVERTGYCLVWIPRAEIVRDVLAVDVTKTGAILVAHLGDVLDDAVAVLADVTESDLALERGAAGEAIRALRDGHEKAAQALAASVFTSIIHLAFQTRKIEKIRKQMAETHPEKAGILELRLRTIYLAAARALDCYRPETGRPVRREFNRHNTAHRITPEQWTDANALRAVMLVTALLRELNFWFVRE